MLLNLVCSELSSCSIVLHISDVMTIDNFFSSLLGFLKLEE